MQRMIIYFDINDKTNIDEIPSKSMWTPAHTLNSTMGLGVG